jgi:hypothetical protein
MTFNAGTVAAQYRYERADNDFPQVLEAIFGALPSIG